MTKRNYLFILFFVAGVLVANAYESQDTLKRHSLTPIGEVSKEKEIIINPEALKAINLGSPRVSSPSSSFMSPTDVKDLTNEILGKKKNLQDPREGKIMLGMSCFASFYENPKHGQKLKVDPMGFGSLNISTRRGMELSKAAMTPRYLSSDKIATMFGPSSNPLLSFSAEDILRSIFWRNPPDLWTHYGDLSKNLSVETELPDSLVRIRMASVSMMDSLIKTSQKKYKIVYLFCDDADYSKANFPEIAKYVASNKEKFDLFPVSGKKDDDVSCIAKYLKKVAYFSPVYVMSGRHKESLILMLDQNNEAISLLACDTSMSKKLDELKLLP
jgi:hypothetical protein